MPTPSRPSATTSTSTAGRRAVRPAGAAALLGAVVFLGAYLANDAARGAVATREMPLPNAAPEVLLEYVRGEGPALVLPALTHLVSVAGLLLFVLALLRVAPVGAGTAPARWGPVAVVVAVASMTVSAALSILTATVTLSDTVTLVVHQASFVTGGVAHVVALGLGVALLGRMFAARGVRVFSVVAAVPAILSVISLVWFYGNALILVGRVLSMAWVLVAGAVLAVAARPLRDTEPER